MPDSPADQIEVLLRKHAENPEGRYFVPLANNYRKLGEIDEAERYLREGLRKHPNYLSAHIVLAQCLADRGADAEAAAEFRHVLSIDPHNLIALRTLGDLARAGGQASEARRWYGELLAVDPMNEEVRQALDTLEALGGAGVDAAGEMDAEEFEAGGGWWAAPADAEVGRADDATQAGMVEAEAGDDAARWESSVWAAEDEVSFESEPLMDLDLSSLDLGDEDEEAGLDAAPAAAFGGDAVLGEEEFEIAPGPGALDAAGGETPQLLESHDVGAEPAGEAGVGEDEEEVVTETIAELYATQGFHDRAADVYRRLIRRHGETPALVGRLEEMERLAAGAGDAAESDAVHGDAGSVPASEAEAWETSAAVDGPVGVAETLTADRADEDEVSDAFAASFADGFGDVADGFGDVSENGDGERVLTPWTEAADEPWSQEAPAEVVRIPALADWTAADAEDDSQSPAELETAAADLAEAGMPEAAGSGDAGQKGAPVPAAAGTTVSTFFAALLGWTPGAASAAPAAVTEGAAEEPFTVPADEIGSLEALETLDAADVPGIDAFAPGAPGDLADLDEPMPWETLPEPAPPAMDAAASVAPESAGTPVASDPFSFDDLFEEPDAEAPAGGAEPQQAAQPQGTQEASAAAGGGEDDEDLESFQAWLRSLKR